MPAVSLSASTLKLYRECPRCFWLAMKKKVERPRGPFPSPPSGMDGVLKRYFDGYRQRGLLPPLLNGPMPSSAQACTFCQWLKAVHQIGEAG